MAERDIRANPHGRADVRAPIAGQKRPPEGTPTDGSSELGRPELDTLRAAFVTALRLRGLMPSLQVLEQLRAVIDVGRFAPQTVLANRVITRDSRVIAAGPLTTLTYTCPAARKARVLHGLITMDDQAGSTYELVIIHTPLGVTATDVAFAMWAGASSTGLGGARLGPGLLLFGGDTITMTATRTVGAVDSTIHSYLSVLEVPRDEAFME